MKKYLVTYTDDSDGISTTEQQEFTDHGSALEFYNERESDGSPNVYLCEILMSTNLIIE